MKRIFILILVLLLLAGCTSKSDFVTQDDFVESFNSGDIELPSDPYKFKYSERVDGYTYTFENGTTLTIGVYDGNKVGTVVLTADFALGEKIGSEWGAAAKNIMYTTVDFDKGKLQEIYNGLKYEDDETWEAIQNGEKVSFKYNNYEYTLECHDTMFGLIVDFYNPEN